MSPGQEKSGGRGGGSNPAAASQTKPGSNLTATICHQSDLKIQLMYGHKPMQSWVCTHPK